MCPVRCSPVFVPPHTYAQIESPPWYPLVSARGITWTAPSRRPTRRLDQRLSVPCGPWRELCLAPEALSIAAFPTKRTDSRTLSALKLDALAQRLGSVGNARREGAIHDPRLCTISCAVRRSRN